MENKSDKQLVVWIPMKLHADVKYRAALRNISMALWVERALTQAVEKEKEYDTE